MWVTGASSGIGEAIAIDMCARGAKLVLSARRQDELERVKKLCKGRGLRNASDWTGKNASSIFILRLDLEDYASHEAAVAQVISRFGSIDILVNNGGRSQRALVETTALQVDRDMMALNVIGSVIRVALTAQAQSLLQRQCCHT